MRPRASTIAEFPAPPPPGSRTPSKPPGTKKGRERDPIDVVCEAIGELDFLDSAKGAAAVCAAALQLGLRARAVIIHAHDAATTEVRVVAANGPKADELVGKAAVVEDDVVASTVIAANGTMTLTIDPEVGLPKRAPERLKAVGASRVVFAMPVFVKNRIVSILEIVDADESSASAVEPAAEYAARQLARFLEARKSKKK